SGVALASASAVLADRPDPSRLPAYPDLSCPFVDPSEVAAGYNSGASAKTRHVFAAVAAFEARYLNTSSDYVGIVYDGKKGVYDPDGLMFVSIDTKELAFAHDGHPAADPATVILQKERAGALDDLGRFVDVAWGKLLQAAKSK